MKLIVEFTHNDKTTRHSIAVKDEYCTLSRHKMIAIMKRLLTCAAADIANELPDMFHVEESKVIDVKELKDE